MRIGDDFIECVTECECGVKHLSIGARQCPACGKED